MLKKKSLALLLTSVLTMGVLSGCSSKSINESSNETRKVQSVKGEVEIPANPQKIVDISGSTEELLILDKKPVGSANVDSYQTDKFPSYIEDKLEGTKIVGHSMMDTMDMEAILSLNPDLIIMSQRQEKIYDQLKEIAPVVMMKDYANDWKTKLVDVAKLFNQENVANDWIQKYDEKAQEMGKEVIAKNGNQTYLPVLSITGSFMVFSDAGIGTIINEDMKLARPENMPKQDGITLPTVTMEGLTKIDSDHIVAIATESDKKDLEKSSVWSQVRSVKEDNATILDAIPYFTQCYNPIGREMLLEPMMEALTK